jgi:MAE_28990/MAE_18760-like HEPN
MRDIARYLRLLRFIEQAGGKVWIAARKTREPVDQSTVHVLKAGAFLHMYNLVEFTVSDCLQRISAEITVAADFGTLGDPWRKAWVTSKGKLDRGLNPENMVTAAVQLCHEVAAGHPLQVEARLGSGNLDDRKIEEILARYGVELKLSKRTTSEVKHRVHNDVGFLGLVREVRNQLAHGGVSFADIGQNHTTADLIRWTLGTNRYLREVIANFQAYLDRTGFLRPP